MKLKTKKALSKKVKVTRNKKVVRRYSGQNHYNVKESGKQRRQKRKAPVLRGLNRKNIVNAMSV